MNKKGIVLIFSLIVVLVLSILSGYFFLKSINENNLVKRHINSLHAFWTAEAGIAEAVKNLPSSPNNGSLGSYSYQATTAFRTTIAGCNYYDITSIATVGNVVRTIHVIVKTGNTDASKFQYGIQAANDLCFGGNCKADPDKYVNEPTDCNGHACWKDLDAALNFSDMFGYEQSKVSDLATHYTNATFPGEVHGVTWVDVDPGTTLMVTSSVISDGILIINGNVHFGGTYHFDGIVYVLGTLEARGTFVGSGSFVVASTAGIDSINGTPDFHWNLEDIQNALNQLAFHIKAVVSWWES